ncbi:MAG TPA: TrbC/VirB2 family protein [Microvirga sp.]|jgi:type IV secretion system protein VirB2|nr:TrbC/VirB2 family protein [Microvirga sp.]
MNRSSPLSHTILLTAMTAVVTLGMTETAFAQAANIQSMLQNIVNALTGEIARLLAIIAVILVGLAWMFGALDIRRAGIVLVGIAIVFGATELVGTITGGGTGGR